ncbi:hypothetical protein HYE67_000223 [Fusarium culmorum]|uniref:C2H2-type domain-containing protein n=1 Tax=Fusarium culmorum TaxID=5516 RepID=A0A2T4GEW1_FUSCU|nr:hypothetical protein FCULG_00012176 [Fusarium culmorum]QPC57992.1 hypothetical protein HYE67_000223 [Fusarium culmorum]
MSGRGSPRIDQPVVESDWLSWLHNTEDIWGEDGSATTHVKHAPPIDRPFQPELSQQDSEADGFAPPSSDAFTEDTSWLSSSGYYGAPSDSSIGSANSIPSSLKLASRLRRRRKQMNHQMSSTQDGERTKRRYQCTFCTDAFKTKHDWQRHETTMHLSLEQWKCSRYGPTMNRPDGKTYCIFCNCPDPTAEHPELHNYSACVAQPGEARLFHRKDHLRQHLRLFHQGCNFNDSMKSWLSSVDDIVSRCGFCDVQMASWAERQKHLAAHFRQGSDMREWKGDRGFAHQVDEFVENDMPVFLIGDQRRTMEPFSASRANHRENSSPHSLSDLVSTDPNIPGLVGKEPELHSTGHSYREVEQQLLRYVSTNISQGHVPSDQQIQRKMSEIMYGPDNMWDNTWADNPQWLGMFRKKAGLISLPLSGGKNAFIGF